MAALPGWVADLLGRGSTDRAHGGRGRTTGRPSSTNGASSLHLRWDLDARCTSVAVTLTVLNTPAVPALYFWALQVDVADPSGRAVAGAHAGLQWHPAHPGSTAVNWGGYRSGGGELEGSTSALRSATANPNTRDLAWRTGVPYGITVTRVDDAGAAPPGRSAWRATVTDVDSGEATVVRDLWMPEGDVVGMVVWSEVFARCDHPTVAVRWSDPSVTTVDGRTLRPDRASVNYQSHTDGGCANTCSWSAGDGLHQRTNTERTTAQGAVLPWL